MTTAATGFKRAMGCLSMVSVALMGVPGTASAKSAPVARYILVLDGAVAGELADVQGGGAVGNVVTDPAAGAAAPRKHLNGVTYEDITLTCGAGMTRRFYAWLADSIAGKHTRQDGAIHTCDYDGNIVSTLDFFHGLISEVGFPALDAGSKDEATMTLKFTPEKTLRRRGDGHKDKLNIVQKPWTPRNFRLTIDGLGAATRRVTRIGALSIRIPSGKEPTEVVKPQPSTLVITVPESEGNVLWQWHQAFVIDGANDPSKEKTGKIEYLGEDSKPLFTIDLLGLGIFAATPEKPTALDPVARLSASIYIQELGLTIPPTVPDAFPGK